MFAGSFGNMPQTRYEIVMFIYVQFIESQIAQRPKESHV